MIKRIFSLSVTAFLMFGFMTTASGNNKEEPSFSKTVYEMQGTGGGLITPGATLKTIRSGFVSAEGPAADTDGNIYFTDIRAGQIWKWSWSDGAISLYKENMSEPNGLYFDSKGRLVICEMKKNRVLLDDMNGNITVIADSYDGKKLHMPNDLWVDPSGGIYFSDFIGPGEEVEEGLQVYYIAPDYKTLTKVTTDLEHPNGVIGTPDGKTLYIAELNVVWAFDIQPDGSLSGKRYFCGENADGFTMDEKDNLYCTGERIAIYNPEGEKIEVIETPASNLTFGGKDRTTLFITARESISTLEMSVKGAPTAISENPSAGSAPPAPSRELESAYLIDFLSPPNAGDKTLYISKSEDGKVTATWECTEHGFQKLTNVSFDGEILTFNALSGTPGDEYFYFHLESYGAFLLGYAKTKEGHKSPVVAKAIE